MRAALPTVVTEKEWQDRYEITSIKGRIWKRSELLKRAAERLKTFMPDKPPSVLRTAVLLVLDDESFMRFRKGTIPARVIDDAQMEAMLRLLVRPVVAKENDRE
jgi:hypothetical protein